MQKEELKKQTLQQLQKDFGGAWNFEEGETASWQYGELHRYTETLLSDTFHRDTSAFMQWMYRIDIPEQDLRMVLKQEHSFTTLAEWVIRREFLKVLLRNRHHLDEAGNFINLLS